MFLNTGVFFSSWIYCFKIASYKEKKEKKKQEKKNVFEMKDIEGFKSGFRNFFLTVVYQYFAKIFKRECRIFYIYISHVFQFVAESLPERDSLYTFFFFLWFQTFYNDVT